MGKPKLLLPWQGKTVMDHVLQVWTTSDVTETVVVIRRDDVELQRVCARWPVAIVQPSEAPADMKASVQAGLRFLEQHHEPSATDHCFIAPADLPTLQQGIIPPLLAAPKDPNHLIVPQFGGKQGHPVLLPWPLTSEIHTLAADQGVDTLVARHPQTIVPFPAADRVTDVDTPAEYQMVYKNHHG